MTVYAGTHIMAIRSSVSTKKYYKLFFMSVSKDLCLLLIPPKYFHRHCPILTVKNGSPLVYFSRKQIIGIIYKYDKSVGTEVDKLVNIKLFS